MSCLATERTSVKLISADRASWAICYIISLLCPEGGKTTKTHSLVPAQCRHIFQCLDPDLILLARLVALLRHEAGPLASSTGKGGRDEDIPERLVLRRVADEVLQREMSRRRVCRV